MKLLKRNKKTFYYATYLGLTEIVDESGRRTGEKVITYSNPVKCEGSISPSSGMSETMQFGENVDYDRTVILEGTRAGITEVSVLWIDTMPVLKEDGSTDTPYDYIVKKVAPNINFTSIAVSKVKVR